MPTTQQHIIQSERNEALFQQLSNGPYTDWAITALFYAALHLIDAWLPAPSRPRRHVARIREIAATPRLAVVELDYQELKDRSEDGRYNCARFTTADLQIVHSRHYLPLRGHLRGLLGI
jgi:hypothetical protein